MSKSHIGVASASAVALLFGTAAGYTINEMARSGQSAELEQELARLNGEARQRSEFDVPTDEEASAAISKSGRSIRISECKPRQAVPGVTCTGAITTISGSFAGLEQPGVLSFAKIGDVWTQIQ